VTGRVEIVKKLHACSQQKRKVHYKTGDLNMNNDTQENPGTGLAPDQVATNWDCIADSYQAVFECLTAQFAEQVLDLLDPAPGQRWIDVAAGTGHLSLAAARRGADVLATDFSTGMVEHIQARVEQESPGKIETAVMDGQDLSVSDAGFDISSSIVGLIFFPDIDQGFRELKRVIKPGGRTAVVCWEGPEHFDMMRLLRAAMEDAIADFEMPQQTPVWARLTGVDALREKFLHAGYDHVETFTRDGVHELDDPAAFWDRFVAASPPMIALFSKLGEENTQRVGEAFVRLAQDYVEQGKVVLRARACIGIASIDN
jgi:ubiquinone/menaquinone biosynthesis C-methylase UbiE